MTPPKQWSKGNFVKQKRIGIEETSQIYLMRLNNLDTKTGQGWERKIASQRQSIKSDINKYSLLMYQNDNINQLGLF